MAWDPKTYLAYGADARWQTPPTEPIVASSDKSNGGKLDQ